MKILVTGGAGFIGANLVRRLVQMGCEVVVLDDFSSSSPRSIEGLPVTVVRGSVTNLGLLSEAASGASAIVHLAARGSVPRSISNPQRTFDVNAVGTLNVVEVARDQGQYVIYSSSSSVYGANPVLPKTELDWTRPISPYGASKLAAESTVLAHSHTFGFAALALRFFNVFGPGQLPNHQYAAVIPKWMWTMMKGEPIQVQGDGTQTRDFTYIDNVVSVLTSALERRLSPGAPVNLAFGQPVSLLDLVALIESALNTTATIEFTEPRIGDIPHSRSDPQVLLDHFPGVNPTPWPVALKATQGFLSGI